MRQPLPQHEESGMSKGRMEAFSDGVMAILITIMVLELAAPHEAGVRRVRAGRGDVACAGSADRENTCAVNVGWLAYVKDPDGNVVGLMQPDEHAA